MKAPLVRALFLVVLLSLTAAAAVAQTARAAPRAAAAAGVRSVELPPTAGAWALSTRTGGVAVVEPGQNQVTLYPSLASAGTIDDARRQSVGAEPASIAYKPLKDKGYFLVACTGDRTIHVLDEATLAPAKVFPIDPSVGGARMVAAAASPDSPHAFYAAANGSAQNFRAGVGRLDLSALRDEGLLEVDGAGSQGDRYDVWPSEDGRTLYLRRPHLSPAGVYAWRVEPPAADGRPPRALRLQDAHDQMPAYVPDRLGAAVAAGHKLFTPDLKVLIADLPAQPVCFLADRPVIIAATPAGLTALSYNTYRAIGQPVPLPAPAPAPADEREARLREMKAADPTWDVLADEKSGQLLVRERSRVSAGGDAGAARDLGGHQVTIVPLAQFRLPDEPFLYVTTDGPTELTAGEPWSAKVVRRDPGARVELASAPDGVRLEGDVLSWTPTGDQVGVATPALRVSGGTVERTQGLKLTVRRRGLSLPFVPQEMLVTPDGSRVVVLNASSGTPDARARPEDDRATRVAVVDVATCQVVAQRVMPFDVSLQRHPSPAGAADAERLYLPLASADAFVVLSLEDLSDVKRVFTPGRPESMTVAGGRLYVTVREKPMQVYALPAIEPVAPPADDPQAQHGYARNLPPEWVGYGWLHDGVVYDAAMARPRLLVRSDLVRTMPLRQPVPGVDERDGRPPVAPWGVGVNGGGLQRLAGQAIGAVPTNTGPAGAVQLLTSVPAAAALAVDGATQGRFRAEVVLYDLITAAPSKPFVLLDEPPRPGRHAGGETIARLEAPREAAGPLVALVHDQLFFLPAEEFAQLSLPEPLWLEPEQGALVAAVAEPTRLAYKAHGGRAPLTWSLAVEQPGVSIDPATGVVTVNPGAASRGAPEVLRGEILDRWKRSPYGLRDLPPDQAMEQYRTVAGAWVMNLRGVGPTGLPLALPIVVEVRDAEQQAARLSHLLVLDVDPAAVGATMGVPNAMRREPARANPPAAGAAVAAGGASGEAGQRAAVPATQPLAPAPPDEDVASLKRRVAELEEENSRLRQQNRILLKRAGSGR